MFQHYLKCEALFVVPENALDPIKKEQMDENDAPKKSKKKSAVEKRMTNQIVKSEFNFNEANDEDINHDENEEIMEYEPDFDAFQNNDDSDEEIPPNPLEPTVKIEAHEGPAINIKQEKASQSAIQQRISEMIRSIKQEKYSENENVIESNNTTENTQVNIKPEKNTNEPVSIKFLNPLAVKNKSDVKKKIYQMSPALLARIKKEKIDAEERDEAEPEDEDLFSVPSILKIKQEKFDERDEAEPEDEDLLHGTIGREVESPIVKIKKEKVDTGYGVVMKKPKQLINPLALLNAQKVLNGTSENSLMISTVTSINQNEEILNVQDTLPPSSSPPPQSSLTQENKNENENIGDNPKVQVANNASVSAALEITEKSSSVDSNEIFNDLLNSNKVS